MTIHIDLFTSFVFGFEIWFEEFHSIFIRNTYTMVSNNELSSEITCRIFNIKLRNKHIYHITMFWKLDCVLDQVN